MSMDKNKSEDAKKLLEKEIDEINDSDKKERMKYFLSEYSKPKFNINTSVYVFFITAIICFFWQNHAQQRCIEEQQQEINSLILYMIYTNPEMFPNDTIFPDMSEPYDFEQVNSQNCIEHKFI